jgi:TPR repeat protein
MNSSKTALSLLENDCIRAFGQETGRTLLQQAEELYQDLCRHGNDWGNHVIREHLQSRLFPLMAYYKVLLKHGIQEDQALLLVRETAHKAAIDQKAEMQKLGALPFAYLIYRLGVKRHMKNHFPPEGWQTGGAL